MWLNAVFVFIFGLLIGSFLNVVIWRLPKSEKITGRSKCVKCDRILTALDLIPVASYIFLRGKCGNCGQKISPRYPIIELSNAVLYLCAYLYLVSGFSVDFSWVVWLKYALVISVAIVTFVVDLEHFLILDKVTYLASILLGVILLLQSTTVGQVGLKEISLGVLAGVAPFFCLWLLSKGRWIGLGDVKFMLFMGLALGFPLVLVGELVAFWLGTLVALPLLIFGKKTLTSKLPLGTFLSISMVGCMFFGQDMLTWYLNLLF